MSAINEWGVVLLPSKAECYLQCIEQLIFIPNDQF